MSKGHISQTRILGHVLSLNSFKQNFSLSCQILPGNGTENSCTMLTENYELFSPILWQATEKKDTPAKEPTSKILYFLPQVMSN